MGPVYTLWEAPTLTWIYIKTIGIYIIFFIIGRVYVFVIEHCAGRTIEECNELLNALGVAKDNLLGF